MINLCDFFQIQNFQSKTELMVFIEDVADQILVAKIIAKEQKLREKTEFQQKRPCIFIYTRSLL